MVRKIILTTERAIEMLEIPEEEPPRRVTVPPGTYTMVRGDYPFGEGGSDWFVLEKELEEGRIVGRAAAGLFNPLKPSVQINTAFTVQVFEEEVKKPGGLKLSRKKPKKKKHLPEEVSC